MTSFFSFGKSNDIQTQFNNWINKIINNDSPDSSIIAINFGIFESEKGYKVYLAGFENYDKDGDDWATGLGDFSPKDLYFQIPEKEYKDSDWQAILDKVVDLINKFMSTDFYKDSFLDKAIVISTGFDDGDLIKIK
jgi:hypothetical protein